MPEPKSVALTQLFWLLDYDGSLCPHREEWEFGHYDPQLLCQILDALAKRSAGLMWNTGRSVESLTSQSPLFTKHPGFFEHGAFFWDGKSKTDLLNAALPQNIIERVKVWASTRAEWLRLEFKHHSMRIIPLHAQDRSRLRAEFMDSELNQIVTTSSEVYASEGWRAFEIMLTGANKSNATAYLKSTVPVFAKSVPVAVGDDIGDAQIVRDVLALGGHVFLIGSHCGWIAEIPHKSSQVTFFSTPQELLNHLEEVLKAGELIDLATKTKIPHASLVS